MCVIDIRSDFNDYYDDLSVKTSLVKYNRFEFGSKPRGVALNYLKQLGVRTVEFGQLSNLYDKKAVVVYTDVNAHHSNGKQIMQFNEAQYSYGNFLASEYIETNTWLKYVKIGDLNVNILFERDNSFSLEKGTIKDIKIVKSGFDKRIALPIFSIDYVPYNDTMLATDFNIVQNLFELGLQDYISKEEVIDQIYKSLVAYNKI